MTTTKELKFCGDCRWWTGNPNFFEAVGECKIDMETKERYHDACANFERKEEVER